MSLMAELILEAYARGYRVDDDGNLRTPENHLRADCPDGSGYRSVSSRLLDPKKPRRLYLHRLMAYQKFGESLFEKGIQVRHLNENPADNRPANIAIGTQSQNRMDMPRAKRVRLAKNASRSLCKLNDGDHAALLEELSKGTPYSKLQKRFGVAKSTIARWKKRLETGLTGGARENAQ